MNIDGRYASRALALVVAALLALPVAVVAQGQQHRHGQEPEAQAGQKMGMMGMMAGPSPGMILRQREAVDLTEEQVRELEALEERLAETRAGHMEAMQTVHQRLAEQATAPDLDPAAYESTLRSLADQHIAMHVAMARVGQEARQVLTAEQREKLQIGMQFMRGAMMQMMGARMEGMGPGGGMDSMMGQMGCPMMRGSGSSNP